jgi:hypothetical protein
MDKMKIELCVAGWCTCFNEKTTLVLESGFSAKLGIYIVQIIGHYHHLLTVVKLSSYNT